MKPPVYTSDELNDDDSAPVGMLTLVGTGEESGSGNVVLSEAVWSTGSVSFKELLACKEESEEVGK